jgi:Uma2 family endonuclease
MPDGGNYELVNGHLVERELSTLSIYVAGEVHAALRSHVKPVRLGWVFPEGASYQCFSDDPGRVRKADTSFIALNRLTAEQATAEGHCPVVPDLVVEVLSPNDLAYRVDEKIEEWLSAGVRVIWIVNPETRSIRIERADRSITRLREADTLTCEELLPGFSYPVADLFRLPTAA